jgi:hypothetical protein
MKKIILFSLLVLSGVASSLIAKQHSGTHSCWDLAFTSGYVFKSGDRFKDVYGHGMINTITGDGCFYPWKHGGFGAKFGYWRAKGQTTFLNYQTVVQEVPVTIYARGRKNLSYGLQLYGSLGAGFAWIKEKSYLGNVHLYRGLGELEVGLNWNMWRCVNLTGAVRYLFPPQHHEGAKFDAGGVDLRAGIGFSF